MSIVILNVRKTKATNAFENVLILKKPVDSSTYTTRHAPKYIYNHISKVSNCVDFNRPYFGFLPFKCLLLIWILDASERRRPLTSCTSNQQTQFSQGFNMEGEMNCVYMQYHFSLGEEADRLSHELYKSSNIYIVLTVDG